MSELQQLLYAGAALVGLVCVTTMLYAWAQCLSHERRVHDLKLRVIDVRKAYHRKLAAGRTVEAIPVDELSDEEFARHQTPLAAGRAAA